MTQRQAADSDAERASRAPPRVCVGAVLQRSGRTLLVLRAAQRQWMPGVWDLPGGHCEPDELPEAALARELDEELGVTPLEWCHLATARTEDVTLHVYRVIRWSGSPRNARPDEHDAIAWLTAERLHGLPLADNRLRALLDDP